MLYNSENCSNLEEVRYNISTRDSLCIPIISYSQLKAAIYLYNQRKLFAVLAYQ
ncbi:uncharacterized protein Dsimw501_GD27256 [Drosophila simulans]|uniref:Uncharacterized protein n=1 Tax=Drosophila simulans TaxID=7240 RepID=A0A0J9RNR2_DROSI|nr:uncharacterized protein Dsimw501_GD27256 [Drosophila simulans]